MIVELVRRDGRVRHYRHGYKPNGKAEPEYTAWLNARARCHNPKSNRFPRYGARGIEMCPRWRNSFLAFLEDVGRKPTPEHTLERRDNNRGYEPGNCYWTTRKKQARNRSTSRFLTVNGRRQTMAAWAEEAGISISVIHSRLKRGWTEEDAVLRPKAGRRH